jgi:hypothetical protein
MRQLSEVTIWSKRHRSLAPRYGGGEGTGTSMGSSRADAWWKFHKASCAIRADQRGTKKISGAVGRNITTNRLLRPNAEAHTSELNWQHEVT